MDACVVGCGVWFFQPLIWRCSLTSCALRNSALVIFLSWLFLMPALGQTPKVEKSSSESAVVERVGDTAFLRVLAPSFEALTPRQQALAYWLTQASIAIDPIIYDQFSAYGLRQKRVLEEIVAHSKGVNPIVRDKIAAYTKVFWANRGNHNDITSQKFLPGFTFVNLRLAAASAWQNGGFRTAYGDMPPFESVAAVKREVDDLRAAFFRS